MNLTKLAALPVRMLARPATRERVEGGSWQNGQWVDTVPTLTEIEAVFQPLRGADLDRMTGGERADQFQAIWSEADLRTSHDDDPPVQADVVIDESGNRWRLLQDGYRVEAGFTYCIGVREDDRGRSVQSPP